MPQIPPLSFEGDRGGEEESIPPVEGVGEDIQPESRKYSLCCVTPSVERLIVLTVDFALVVQPSDLFHFTNIYFSSQFLLI